MARTKLDYKGFLDLRRSAEAMAVVNAEAEALAGRANASKHRKRAKYEARKAVSVPHGSVALVATANMEARRDESENHTLERSL